MHGKQRELDRLKDEEKELMTDIKKSEREIQRIEDDLKVVQELEEEVSQRPSTNKSSIQIDMSRATDLKFVCINPQIAPSRRPRSWRSWRLRRST